MHTSNCANDSPVRAENANLAWTVAVDSLGCGCSGMRVDAARVELGGIWLEMGVIPSDEAVDGVGGFRRTYQSSRARRVR